MSLYIDCSLFTQSKFSNICRPISYFAFRCHFIYRVSIVSNKAAHSVGKCFFFVVFDSSPWNIKLLCIFHMQCYILNSECRCWPVCIRFTADFLYLPSCLYFRERKRQKRSTLYGNNRRTSNRLSFWEYILKTALTEKETGGQQSKIPTWFTLG